MFAPDVLCVQELQPATQEFLDGVLGSHRRVDDAFAGWTNEGNIYWASGLLDKLEHGAEEVGHLEPERRLFWARLRIKPQGRTILVATSHLTTPRHPRRLRPAARRACGS